MQIFVVRAAGPKAGQKLTLEVESAWTVEKLSAHIAEEHGISQELQRLSFHDVDMVGERTLSAYEIHMEAELKLVERPPAVLADEQGTADEGGKSGCSATARTASSSTSTLNASARSSPSSATAGSALTSPSVRVRPYQTAAA
jgi:hypothetical protein